MENKIIETPCISICRQDNGRCVGCGRTMEEIAGWFDYTDAERRSIMERLEKEFNDQFN